MGYLDAKTTATATAILRFWLRHNDDNRKRDNDNRKGDGNNSKRDENRKGDGNDGGKDKDGGFGSLGPTHRNRAAMDGAQGSLFLG